MKTIIVPTDFSETATNAAHYAAKMLIGQYDVNLILYHLYEKASHSGTTAESLDKLRAELMNLGAFKINCLAEEGDDLIECLSRVARHQDAELIIMGITGKSFLEQVIIGSNTLKMAEKNVCPVLIVPPEAKFNGINDVALTSDFKNVDVMTPVMPIKSLLSMFRPKLHIVNVDNEQYVSLTEEHLEQRAKMKEMFNEFNPEFYFIGMNDLHEAINQFATDKHIDLIVVIPKHHSFMTRFYKISTTRKLVYHSSVPILAAHE